MNERMTERMHGRMKQQTNKYMKYCKYMVLLLICCFTMWMTPHTIVMTPAELKEMGGAQHPVVGHFGVMSAKNTAVNLMITCTVLCFLLYQRANKKITVSNPKASSS